MAEVKCEGCGMEAEERSWHYAMVYPAKRAPGLSRARKVKVLVCPVCSRTRKPPTC